MITDVIVGTLSDDYLVITAIIGLVLTLTGFTLNSYRRDRRERRTSVDLERFQYVRSLLRDWMFQNRVYKEALHSQKDIFGGFRNVGTYFLYPPDWVITAPIALSDVTYIWEPTESETIVANRLKRGLNSPLLGRRRPRGLVWPMSEHNLPYRRYSDAIMSIEAPSRDRFRDEETYRLLEVKKLAPDSLSLTFGPMKYFDGFDCAGSLEYEATDRVERNLSVAGPYRRSIRNPARLRERNCSLGISVLTLRRRGDGNAEFYLHSRSGTAGMDGRIGAFPAGEFQPSTGGGIYWRPDLSLWHSIVREYAEEFLGLDEASSQSAVPLQYLQVSPFREIFRALDNGIRVHVLDIGLDPVSLKAGIRVVAVIDEATFERLFANMVDENKEGRVHIPPQTREKGRAPNGWTFTATQVGDLIDGDNALTPAARFLLQSAWLHRHELGLA